MAVSSESNEFRVERATTITALPQQIFDAVADFHRWTEWSPWEQVDPTMQRTYSGAERGVGAVYEWSGNRKAGAGRMEITDANAPSEVRITLSFLKPFKATNAVTFALTPSGDTTNVNWSMTGAKTIVTRIMGLFSSMDKMVGKDFEKGLAQLKATSET